MKTNVTWTELLSRERYSAQTEHIGLHQISPYIGKMNPNLARALIEACSEKGDLIYDPFSGSGTIALESKLLGRNVIAVDASPYAILLTRAKLRSPRDISKASDQLNALQKQYNLEGGYKVEGSIPAWVEEFFHERTLDEIVWLMKKFRESSNYFLAACLLGILHHRRSGFLSYPSGHMVPYLLTKKYPKLDYPHLYEYRSVFDRLQVKLKRVYKNYPIIDTGTKYKCILARAETVNLPMGGVDAVITSPPFMDRLDYGRDNRLRLWFLGVDATSKYDKICNNLNGFQAVMGSVIKLIEKGLKKDGTLVLVLGNGKGRVQRSSLSSIVAELIRENSDAFRLEDIIEQTDLKPSHLSKSSKSNTEQILIYRRY